MATFNKNNFSRTLDAFVKALDSEIKAVKENPSEETLVDGKFKKKIDDRYIYVFPTTNASLRFAEKITLNIAGKSVLASPGESSKEDLEIVVSENLGKEVRQANAKWVNDFILRQIQGQLVGIEEEPSPITEQLFLGTSTEVPVTTDPLIPSHVNERQTEAITKALSQSVSFVWGPPGTGKTSTLGLIAANFMAQNKRILCVSNTNRAVDVAMLSTLDALDQIKKMHSSKNMTRFGELILDDTKLSDFHFQSEIEAMGAQSKRSAGKFEESIAQYLALQNKLENSGQELPVKAKAELELLQKMAEADESDSVSVSEKKILRKKRAVFTTLARVCTSELLHSEEFDAVIVDEASMASLPFMFIMAERASQHLVIAGDPMQLPPISQTQDFKARDVLETDIFAFTSAAQTTEDLFLWHDKNPHFTTFFNTQYRMQGQLAQLVSETFYEGRLKSGKKSRENHHSIFVFDSSDKQGFIEQSDATKPGFRPVNRTHVQACMRLIQQLLYNERVLPYEIGIITPFRFTSFNYTRELRKSRIDFVEAGTIHTFQGREKQIIILDMVMGPELQSNRPRNYKVRPFDEDKNGLQVSRLLNVALSRSKGKLFVLMNSEHLISMYKNQFVGKLARHLKEEATPWE